MKDSRLPHIGDKSLMLPALLQYENKTVQSSFKIIHNSSNTAMETTKNRCLDQESNTHLRVSRPLLETTIFRCLHSSARRIVNNFHVSEEDSVIEFNLV